MAQENVEVILRAFEATNRGDAEAVAALCHDDIEFVSAVLASVGEGTYRGKDAWETEPDRVRRRPGLVGF